MVMFVELPPHNSERADKFVHQTLRLRLKMRMMLCKYQLSMLTQQAFLDILHQTISPEVIKIKRIFTNSNWFTSDLLFAYRFFSFRGCNKSITLMIDLRFLGTIFTALLNFSVHSGPSMAAENPLIASHIASTNHFKTEVRLCWP